MKPFLPVEQQIEKLRSNGLVLAGNDADDARQLLLDHNYYRLSGYFRYFQVNPPAGIDRFTSHASFDDIRLSYELDQQLAEHLRKGLTAFEVVFRSRLAYCIAESSGPDSYLTEGIYLDKPARSLLLADIEKDLKRSDERFVKHHEDRGTTLPVWAAVEALSLGTTSKMYGLIEDYEGVYKPIAERFGISHRYSRKFFRSMTVLRNVCAHHGRIWHRNRGIEIEVPRDSRGKGAREIYKDTPWAWIWSLGHIVDYARGDKEYSDSLWDFIDTTPDWFVDGLTDPSPM
ncbi:Abi family protein [Rhodococcus sp. ACT016]|uniref:Abi family protein n=1 Tax=Rhodococcus sp. ACT016 TaxID=3134808 RepID=UPI003D2DE73C